MKFENNFGISRSPGLFKYKETTSLSTGVSIPKYASPNVTFSITTVRGQRLQDTSFSFYEYLEKHIQFVFS